MIKSIFYSNYLLSLPVLAWLIAQVLKTAIDFSVNRRFSKERLVGSGGMPSSHSALVCSLVVGSAKLYGFSSPWVAFSTILALIVMYDAMGVRQETGKQARIINLLMANLRDTDDHKDYDQKLKEMVGHTPLQVVSGAILGIIIALLIPAPVPG